MVNHFQVIFHITDAFINRFSFPAMNKYSHRVARMQPPANAPRPWFSGLSFPRMSPTIPAVIANVAAAPAEKRHYNSLANIQH